MEQLDLAWKAFVSAFDIAPKSDIFVSLSVGGVLGIAIIVFLNSNPGEPFDYATGEKLSVDRYGRPLKKVKVENDDGSAPPSDETSTQSVRRRRGKGNEVDIVSTKSSDSVEIPESAKEKTEDELLKEALNSTTVEEISQRTERMRALFGVDEDKMKAMIEQARADALDGKLSKRGGMDDDGMSFGTIVNLVFYSVMLSLLVYFAKIEYGIDFFTLLKAWFPKEAGVLEGNGSTVTDSTTV